MPQKRKGTYYLGRVIKGGRLNQDTFVESLLNPRSIVIAKHAWTFIDVNGYQHHKTPFIVGKLIKYSPNAEVKVVQPDIHSELTREEPNLSIASSTFLYIPKHAGIAFLFDARNIPQEVFKSRFCQIIRETNDNFFVQCEIESVSDLQTFANKLKSLSGIYSLSATIVPPNPLFGPLWRKLRKYLEDRNLDIMEVKEEAKGSDPINTSLPAHVQASANQTTETPYMPKEELPITDAAILMAADGYGDGKVTGKQKGKMVTIRTSETTRNFVFERDPDPHEIFEIVNEEFENIESKRHLKH